MIAPRFGPWVFLVAGAGAGALLLVLAGIWFGWDERRGVPCVDCARASTAAPAIAIMAIVAVALIPLATLWFRTGRRVHAFLALWGGVVLAMTLVALVSSELTGALSRFALVVYGIWTTLALLIGGACQALLEMAINARRRHSP